VTDREFAEGLQSDEWSPRRIRSVLVRGIIWHSTYILFVLVVPAFGKAFQEFGIEISEFTLWVIVAMVLIVLSALFLPTVAIIEGLNASK